MKVAKNFMFTQMSEKAGIKKVREKSAASMVKYYIQIYRVPWKVIQSSIPLIQIYNISTKKLKQ